MEWQQVLVLLPVAGLVGWVLAPELRKRFAGTGEQGKRAIVELDERAAMNDAARRKQIGTIKPEWMKRCDRLWLRGERMRLKEMKR